MQKVACVLQTTLIELMVWNAFRYKLCDMCEHETLTDLCFEGKQIQWAPEFHHII